MSGSVGRAIGLDVHRDFCEVAICEAGVVRSAGRIETSPEALLVTCSPAALTVQAAGVRWVCPPSFQVAATSSGVR